MLVLEPNSGILPKPTELFPLYSGHTQNEDIPVLGTLTDVTVPN